MVILRGMDETDIQETTLAWEVCTHGGVYIPPWSLFDCVVAAVGVCTYAFFFSITTTLHGIISRERSHLLDLTRSQHSIKLSNKMYVWILFCYRLSLVSYCLTEPILRGLHLYILHQHYDIRRQLTPLQVSKPSLKLASAVLRLSHMDPDVFYK